MDSTFSNVLEGARQYFQGLPAATGVTSGSPSTNNTQQHPHQHHQQQLQQQPQPQQQSQQQLLQQNHHHIHRHPPQHQQSQQQQHRLPAQLHHQQQHQQRLQQHNQRQNQLIQQQRIQQRLQQQLHQQQRIQPNRDNDGSVRSEQHSAVPYWDQQQNEGQGSHVPNTAIHQPAKQPSYYGPQYQTYDSKFHKQLSVQQQQQQQQQQIQQPQQQQQTTPSYPPQSYQQTYPAYSKYHSSTTNSSNSFSSLIPPYTNYKPYTNSGAGGAAAGSGGGSGSGSSSTSNSQATNYYHQDYRQKHYQAETANQYYQQNTPISYSNAPQAYAQKPPTTAQSYHPPPKSVSTTTQKLLAAKQKRESPLDLSVKTVKTTADSTHIDYDDRKYRPHNPQYQPPPPRAPKIDFMPNFGGSQNYYSYSTAAAPLPRMDFPTKRPQEFPPSQVPEKIPKMESWRQTIDQQIEQKLSSYEFQRKVPPAMIMSSQHQPSQAMPSQHPPPQPLIPQQPHLQQGTKKATKNVLNILRTSLQNKGARKLEQEQQLMRQIQQPTTEVMAPLQPKLGIVGRRNISPFTAVSLERTSNTPPYKPSIPKTVDSDKDPSTDLDGLAAFLAARIRTKAELKQVEETVNNNTSTPKLIHSKMRTDIRSSSETSVFDFQDSDNEMPVLERQSLVEMRKDRKTIPNQIQLPPSPTDELFNSACDQFLEQLRSPSKKPAKPKTKPVKTKVKSDSDSDAPLSQLTTSSATTTTTTPTIKKEQEKDDTVNKSVEVKAKFKLWDEDIKPTLLVTKSAKKPTFGDGSAFQPGWEEDLYRYKKSLRMPRMLIKVSRPPNMHRISTSLPDLDPYPTSPTNYDFKKDSDLESNYSFANDSENSMRSSFIDKLLERYGGRKRKRLKADAPKIIQPPKNSSLVRILNEKATIREVFGEDRPASAPPITCVDDLVAPEEEEEAVKEKDNDSVWTKKQPSISVVIKSGTDKKRGKRKFSSGFDYIRKKKKPVKKDDLVKTEPNEEIAKRPRGRRSLGAKTKIPASVQDIQKEIKTWVLNKGVGETQLHRASRSGFTDIAAYCLEKISCEPSPKDNAGYTPLHEACSKGHLDIARLLLQYGALVSESAQGGIRPLHEAAENGFVEIVRLLLSYGADPTLATYSGITPLQLAVDDATVSLLQQHLNELQGKPMPAWRFNGPANLFDDPDVGFDPLAGAPEGDPIPIEEDIEMEISEQMLPNLYALPDCESERWVLLQDLSNILKIKSKETLLRQLNSNPSSSSASSSSGNNSSSSTNGGADRGNSSSSSSNGDIREMKMTEFLERARCCQFLNANEKLSTRSSKILLVRYTDKVKRLLNVEEEVITGR